MEQMGEAQVARAAARLAEMQQAIGEVVVGQEQVVEGIKAQLAGVESHVGGGETQHAALRRQIEQPLTHRGRLFSHRRRSRWCQDCRHLEIAQVDVVSVNGGGENIDWANVDTQGVSAAYNAIFAGASRPGERQFCRTCSKATSR